jgi:hypothetical protein
MYKSFPRNDFARLALPKESDFGAIFRSSELHKLMKATEDMRKSILSQQSAISGLSSNMLQVAKEMEKSFKPQMEAFRLMQKGLSPLIFRETIFSKEVQRSMDSMKSINQNFNALLSFNSFNIYKETYKEFGGTLNPNNITEAAIQNVIEEHKDIIEEVHQVILKSEANYHPGDIAGLVYDFLVKKIPQLDVKTYTLLVFIFVLAMGSYHHYLLHNINDKVEEIDKVQKEQILPALNKGENEHKDIKQKLDSVADMEKKTDAKLDSIANYENETKSKVDSILELMRNQSKDEAR